MSYRRFFLGIAMACAACFACEDFDQSQSGLLEPGGMCTQDGLSDFSIAGTKSVFSAGGHSAAGASASTGGTTST